LDVLPNPQTLERLAAARLYAITPEGEPAAIKEIVQAWIRGGVDAVQLRHKSLGRGCLLRLALELARLCSASDVLFIVNDHVDIALLSGADGVHLGPDDLSVEGARRAAGDSLVIGASASTPAAGLMAEAAGASYLGSGPAYATPLKTEKRVIGPHGVAAVGAAVAIPVFAIGGIELGRLPELRAAGVTRVCAIRSLAAAQDPESEVRRFREALAR
jgi:thiamine-phosphate pyrophosphorylase